jgi:hypothetical protein
VIRFGLSEREFWKTATPYRIARIIKEYAKIQGITQEKTKSLSAFLGGT